MLFEPWQKVWTICGNTPIAQLVYSASEVAKMDDENLPDGIETEYRLVQINKRFCRPNAEVYKEHCILESREQAVERIYEKLKQG